MPRAPKTTLKSHRGLGGAGKVTNETAVRNSDAKKMRALARRHNLRTPLVPATTGPALAAYQRANAMMMGNERRRGGMVLKEEGKPTTEHNNDDTWFRAPTLVLLLAMDLSELVCCPFK